MSHIELETTGVAVGGAAVGRDADGRVVFVRGALAGERVRVELTASRKRFAEGEVREVLDVAPGRITPICPEVEAGCGGCDLAHADRATQHHAKSAMLADSFERIGRIAPPVIALGPPLADTSFRTTIRAAVRDGRAGLRKSRSHDVLAVGSCRIAHPLAAELLVDGSFDGADEVMIRVGARTGERIVVVAPSAVGVVVPDDVVVVGADELAAGRDAWIHEEIEGRRLRISAGSFFQSRPDGAEQLVALVRGGTGSEVPRVLLDLCCGVGLFAGSLVADSVLAVESSRSSVSDARVNLTALGRAGRVVRSRFEEWAVEPCEVVVADPPRSGLGRRGVAVVAATGASRVVLVSCDAGSLGRDAGLLGERGYDATRCTLVDMFPDTSHIEAVTVFERRGPDFDSR